MCCTADNGHPMCSSDVHLQKPNLSYGSKFPRRRSFALLRGEPCIETTSMRKLVGVTVFENRAALGWPETLEFAFNSGWPIPCQTSTWLRCASWSKRSMIR
jgi:hypothetical protein